MLPALSYIFGSAPNNSILGFGNEFWAAVIGAIVGAVLGGVLTAIVSYVFEIWKDNKTRKSNLLSSMVKINNILADSTRIYNAFDEIKRKSKEKFGDKYENIYFPEMISEFRKMEFSELEMSIFISRKYIETYYLMCSSQNTFSYLIDIIQKYNSELNYARSNFNFTGIEGGEGYIFSVERSKQETFSVLETIMASRCRDMYDTCKRSLVISRSCYKGMVEICRENDIETFPSVDATDKILETFTKPLA